MEQSQRQSVQLNQIRIDIKQKSQILFCCRSKKRTGQVLVGDDTRVTAGWMVIGGTRTTATRSRRATAAAAAAAATAVLAERKADKPRCEAVKEERVWAR